MQVLIFCRTNASEAPIATATFLDDLYFKINCSRSLGTKAFGSATSSTSNSNKTDLTERSGSSTSGSRAPTYIFSHLYQYGDGFLKVNRTFSLSNIGLESSLSKKFRLSTGEPVFQIDFADVALRKLNWEKVCSYVSAVF